MHQFERALAYYTSCHIGLYKPSKLRGTRHKGQNSTVKFSHLRCGGQYKRCVHCTVLVQVYFRLQGHYSVFFPNGRTKGPVELFVCQGKKFVSLRSRNVKFSYSKKKTMLYKWDIVGYKWDTCEFDWNKALLDLNPCSQYVVYGRVILRR